jgi:hypothetical protein
MSKLNISDLAGSEFFTTEDSLLTELTTEATKQIMGGSGHKRKHKGKSKSSKKGRGHGFGFGSSSGRGCGFYCNPYCRT